MLQNVGAQNHLTHLSILRSEHFAGRCCPPCSPCVTVAVQGVGVRSTARSCGSSTACIISFTALLEREKPDAADPRQSSEEEGKNGDIVEICARGGRRVSGRWDVSQVRGERGRVGADLVRRR